MDKEADFREKVRELEKRRKTAQKASQDYCPHLGGGAGDWNSPKTSIVWHTQRGEEFPQGVCLVCLRIFVPTDADYRQWQARPSYSKPSSAGVEAPLTDEDRVEIAKNGFGNLTSDAIWEKYEAAQTVEESNIRFDAEVHKRKEIQKMDKVLSSWIEDQKRA